MKATREAYGEALLELGRLEPRVVVLDADLSKSTRTESFAAAFPERFFNMGVAEADMIGTAAGLAASGKIPFASTFAVFATGRVFDQIRNSVAYPRLNVKIAGSHAGLSVGEDGASHQALEDIALMRTLPSIAIVSPADAPEAFRATLAAARWEGPVYLRLGRPKVPDILPVEASFTMGKGILLKDGGDLTLVATGSMTGVAVNAAEILISRGINARVIHLHTIKPLDEPLLIKAARETGGIITIEEHNIVGGMGSAVTELVSGVCPVPVQRMGVPDCFGESGPPHELLEKYHLTAAHLANAAVLFCARDNREGYMMLSEFHQKKEEDNNGKK